MSPVFEVKKEIPRKRVAAWFCLLKVKRELKIPAEQAGYVALCEFCDGMVWDAPFGASAGRSFRRF
jgi:hypothetical protein